MAEAAEEAPIMLAGTKERMRQLRALVQAGHLRREELEILADAYMEDIDDVG